MASGWLREEPASSRPTEKGFFCSKATVAAALEVPLDREDRRVWVQRAGFCPLPARGLGQLWDPPPEKLMGLSLRFLTLDLEAPRENDPGPKTSPGWGATGADQ